MGEGCDWLIEWRAVTRLKRGEAVVYGEAGICKKVGVYPVLEVDDGELYFVLSMWQIYVLIGGSHMF